MATSPPPATVGGSPPAADHDADAAAVGEEDLATLPRDEYSFHAHKFHPGDLCNPISMAQWELILRLLDLRDGDVVVDFGAGKAGLLLMLLAAHPTLALECHAVDSSQPFVSVAREQCAARVAGLRGSINIAPITCEEFLWSRAAAAPGPAGADGPLGIDAAVCVGSSHTLGGLDAALATLARAVTPGGHVLVGEIYWRRPPSRQYLETLGSSDPDMFRTHQGNIDACRENGLVVVYAATASEADFEQYESLYLYGIQRYAFEHAGHPAADAARARAEAWYDNFLAAGKLFMGFGVYLCRKPIEAEEDG
jgi:SAM-dependent methyltransferase